MDKREEFEEFWESAKESGYTSDESLVRKAWQARQPEIDALVKEIRALTAELKAALTPPAQEDEPAGYVTQYSLNLLAGNYRAVDITIWKHKDAITPHPIYTRPQSDKLREAADEFIDFFNPGADSDRSLEQVIAFLQIYEEKLRAALDKKS